MRYYAVAETAPIKSVLRMQQQQSVFPVINPGTRRYLGVIKVADVSQYLQENPGAQDLPVRDVLMHLETPLVDRVIYIHPDDTPEQARSTMDNYGLNFLPVVNAQGIFVGTIDREGVSRLTERR